MDRPRDEMAAQICPSCMSHDTYEPRLITYLFQLRGRVRIFEKVPALVCSQCGEKLLDGEAARLIDTLGRGDSPPRMTEVPVYDFADFA